MRARRDKLPMPSEHEEQAAVVDWWGWNCKRWGLDERLLIAIPNAAKRSYALAARLKAEGMRSGCPDLFLARPRPLIDDTEPAFCGLWIEMKRLDGKPSQAQLEMADLLRRQGYSVVIAKGAQEAIRAIEGYLGPGQVQERAKLRSGAI